MHQSTINLAIAGLSGISVAVVMWVMLRGIVPQRAPLEMPSPTAASADFYIASVRGHRIAITLGDRTEWVDADHARRVATSLLGDALAIED
jgi:hypothetical protein